MILSLIELLDPSDVTIIVSLIVLLCVGIMMWWEFYAKPCRDALEEIVRLLHVVDVRNQKPSEPGRRIA